MTPKIIIVSGLPGAGKTTLGRKIARKLGFPFFHKDGIREILFENFSQSQTDDTKSIQAASYDVLYAIAREIVSAGDSAVLESNFEEQFDTPRFLALQEKFNCTLIQIYCQIDEKVAFNRFKERAQRGDRHPSHSTHQTFESFKKSLLDNRQYHLKLPGITVDTTTLEGVNLEEIITKIEQF